MAAIAKAAAALIAAILAAAITAQPALGGGPCQECPPSSTAAARPPLAADSRPRAAVARIWIPTRGGAYGGSAALVADDGRRAFLVTAAHVLRQAPDTPPRVYFPTGQAAQAAVAATDARWDLAALEIASPTPPIQPLELGDAVPDIGDLVTAFGYGGTNQPFRAAAGPVLGYLTDSPNTQGYWVEVAAGVRQGDSGGPVLDARGRLVGVLWGGASAAAGPRCVFTCLPRIRAILRGLVPRAIPLPTPRRQPSSPARPPPVAATPSPPPWADRPAPQGPPAGLDALPAPQGPPAALDALPARQPSSPARPPGPYVTPAELAARLRGLASRADLRAATTPLARDLARSTLGLAPWVLPAALGLGVPPLSAALALALARRHLRRRLSVAAPAGSPSSPPSSPSAADLRTENRYVTTPDTAEGEAYREAMRREAAVNPRAHPALHRVESTVKSILDGRRAAWRLGWQDN